MEAGFAWERDNKDKITRVRGLITSKVDKKKRKGRESDASPVIVSWRGKNPHLVRQRSLEVPPQGSFISRIPPHRKPWEGEIYQRASTDGNSHDSGSRWSRCLLSLNYRFNISSVKWNSYLSTGAPRRASVTGWISPNELQQRGKSDLIRTKVTANAGAKICVIFRRYRG